MRLRTLCASIHSRANGFTSFKGWGQYFWRSTVVPTGGSACNYGGCHITATHRTGFVLDVQGGTGNGALRWCS